MRKLALEIISSFQKLISKTVTTCRVFKAVNLWCYPIRNYFESLLLNELVTFWYFTKMLFKHFHANKSLKQWPMSYPDDKDSPKLSSQLFVRLAKCRLYLHRRVSVITLDYEQIIWPLVIPRQAGRYLHQHLHNVEHVTVPKSDVKVLEVLRRLDPMTSRRTTHLVSNLCMPNGGSQDRSMHMS